MKEIYNSLQNSNMPLFDNFSLNKNGYGGEQFQEYSMRTAVQPISNYVDDSQMAFKDNATAKNLSMEGYDPVVEDYMDLQGSGILDTILRVGKSILGYAAPATAALGVGSKLIDASSGVFNSIKNFTKPKPPPQPVQAETKPTRKPTKKYIENTE